MIIYQIQKKNPTDRDKESNCILKYTGGFGYTPSTLYTSDIYIYCNYY